MFEIFERMNGVVEGRSYGLEGKGIEYTEPLLYIQQ